MSKRVTQGNWSPESDRQVQFAAGVGPARDMSNAERRRTEGNWSDEDRFTTFAAGEGPARHAMHHNDTHRTQGNWTDQDRYANFAAGVTPWVNVPDFYLLAANDLAENAGERTLNTLLDAGHRVLMDSGIFNLTNAHMRQTGCTMDYALTLPPTAFDGFDQLFNNYVRLAQTYGDRLWGYIELDQGGAANKRKTRARLHDLGLDPIPVYHPLVDGWDYFDELAASYARICLGNIVQAPESVRLRLLHTMWERRRAYPGLFVHVLGLTPNDTCLPFMPDSCDSSTWSSGVRWPAVNMGAAMLTRLSINSDPGWRYAPNQPVVPYTEHSREWRPHSPSYFAAVGCYADEVNFTTKVWQRIQADRAAELGETECPAFLEQEGTLCPVQR